jgi:F-type H+-transporting ATPase subunit a
MSAVADAPKQAPRRGRFANMSQGKRILLGVTAVWILGIIFFAAIFGLKSHKAASVANSTFSPTDAFKLDTWFKVGPISFNKGVLYVLLTAGITLVIMLWISRRMHTRPNRVQTAVEAFYDLCLRMSKDNMDEALVRKYFPLVASLFVFILVTNLLGYIPLPVDSGQKFKALGTRFPSFQIYAADTNVAFPLILALGVFAIFNYEGIRHHGFIGYLKSLMPGGVKGGMVPLIFGIEILSVFLRLLSLTVRLWANLLAGHLLIDFMAGELGVLVGLQIVQWFLLPVGIAIYLFEAVLIAGLQAFIFAILTAIYIGGATTSH